MCKKFNNYLSNRNRLFPRYYYIQNQNFWDEKTYRFIKKDPKNKDIVIRQIVIDRFRYQKFKQTHITDQEIESLMKLQDVYQKQFKFQYEIIRGHMVSC